MKLPSFLSKLQKSKRFSSHQVTYAWYRHYKIGFVFLFILTILWGGYLWYFNIYQYRWNDAQKKEYLSSYFKETALKEREFQVLVQNLRNREERHLAPLEVNRNIFEGAE